MAEKSFNEKVIQVSRWLLDKVLFLSNLDMYKIYRPDKNTAEKLKFKLDLEWCQSKEKSWQNKPFKWHQPSDNYYNLIIFIIIYFAVKTSIINIAQLILYRLSHGKDTCPCLWPTCQETLLGWSKALGNPLSELGGGGIFFTWVLAGCISLFVALMAYNFKSHNLDLASLRFYYEPERELGRIDEMIELRLNALLESILNYHGNDLLNYSLWLSEYDPDTRDSERSNRKSMDRVYQQLISYKHKGLKALRPSYYDESNRLGASTEAAWLLVGSYLYFSTCWYTALYVPIFIIAARAKCSSLGVTKCSLTSAFTWQDNICLLEIVIAAMLLNSSATFQIAALLIQLRSNSRLVANMEADLRSCICSLRLYNMSDESLKPESRCEQQQQHQVEKILFENFVKILVTTDELRRGTGSITQLLRPWILISVVLMFLYALVDGMSSQFSKNLKTQILITDWVILNSVAIICAGISSRSDQLQRLYWSIQAELIVYHKRCGLTSRSFISLAWKRLSYYARSTSHLNTSKPFNIALNYANIIEINFSIVSVVALLTLQR